ncbi:Uu.00g104510.m01.CDS01 [Anthostomella pinea]|uniref:Uu.00g104510.m01.CDS01 n=1 Tax=Anthostomella pinea TaxID=933095 RepID=A0AAI8YFP7_9PEZI|nr:Uu.00g104510.m01.CDS01 [Anthostomella pinea]
MGASQCRPRDTGKSPDDRTLLSSSADVHAAHVAVQSFGLSEMSITFHFGEWTHQEDHTAERRRNFMANGSS